MSGHHEFTSSEAVQYQPQARAQGHALPAQEARPKFTLVHFTEGGWDYDARLDAFIPRPAEIFHVPGVNGIAEDGDPSPALNDCRQRGGVVIDQLDPRLGKFRGYLVGYPCEGGGMAWTFRKSKGPIRTAQGRCVWPKTSDWDDFCLHLVKSGIVERMPVWVWASLEQRQASVAAQKQAIADRDANRIGAAKAAWAKLDKMRAAWARYNGETEEDAEGVEVEPSEGGAPVEPTETTPRKKRVSQ